jgi:hypothetical protein
MANMSAHSSTTKYWVVGVLLALAGGLAAFGFHATNAKHELRLVSVGGRPVGKQVVPYGSRSLAPASVHSAGVSERAVLGASVAPQSPQEVDPLQSPVAIQTLALAGVIEQLARDGTLNDKERTRLERTFRLAARLQQGVDHESDPARQVERQRNLIEQVVNRLRIILQDDERVERVKLSLAGLPRLEYEQ